MRASWLLNEYRLKEAGQGSDGPSSARANNLLSRAAGKARNYPTAYEGVRVRACRGCVVGQLGSSRRIMPAQRIILCYFAATVPLACDQRGCAVLSALFASRHTTPAAMMSNTASSTKSGL
ncbi:hypothetical protein LMG9964_05179 [Paraburkholderia phenoliruptrix]|uniref:Uncharacterized protein n=1 Tax=Paraburkholderia phenoliruptrix TaxID=252970 RepID=A0A6J5KC84_9BURK|nr:hypothetical protein LMG9964_05179 [Paraburkholderia phenoliruptrix]